MRDSVVGTDINDVRSIKWRNDNNNGKEREKRGGRDAIIVRYTRDEIISVQDESFQPSGAWKVLMIDSDKCAEILFFFLFLFLFSLTMPSEFIERHCLFHRICRRPSISAGWWRASCASCGQGGLEAWPAVHDTSPAVMRISRVELVGRIPPKTGRTAAAEQSIKMLPEARRHTIKCDGVDATVDISQAEPHNLKVINKIML